MKLYIIEYGFYSSCDNYYTTIGVWTNKEEAIRFLKKRAIERNLEQSKKNEYLFSDGDYHIVMTEINSDTDDMYGV